MINILYIPGANIGAWGNFCNNHNIDFRLIYDIELNDGDIILLPGVGNAISYQKKLANLSKTEKH